jgi:succinyl-diaminopimelate desuccinylase
MFAEWIEGNKQRILSSTQELLQIPSVGGEPAGSDKPFGIETDRALQYMLRLGNEHGFKVKNVDGYAGHIEYGAGEDYVAVLAHLDVVPTGTGWTYPPFAAEIHDGMIYARGAIDDKGPAMAAFYGLLALKESGVPIKRRVRLILGLDEETDWRCMDYYFQQETQPWGGFTPDADFPLIYAEKGIISFELSKFRSADRSGNLTLLQVTGGERPNIVPDICQAFLVAASDEVLVRFQEDLKQYCETEHIRYSLSRHENNEIVLTVEGRSAHGSLPFLGVNAVHHMGKILRHFLNDDHELWEFVASYDTEGKFLGINGSDEITGALSCNLGILKITEQNVSLVFDVRYPIDQTRDGLVELIQGTITETGFRLRVMHDLKPLYVSQESPVVSKLLHVYETITGQSAEPITIGGGTYARTIRNGVAFGPMFPGMADIAHQRDERISVDHLLTITNLYANAIYELAKS